MSLMNLDELASAVEKIGIPEEVVILGGHGEQAWCVEKADDGNWEVFWQERGNKNDLVRLQTEDQACNQLLGQLAYSQLLAGVLTYQPR